MNVSFAFLLSPKQPISDRKISEKKSYKYTSIDPKTVFQAQGALAKDKVCGAKMNAKETDQYKRAMLRKKFTSRCHGPAPQQAWWTYTRQTQETQEADIGGAVKADTWRTQGGHMDKIYGVQGLEADARRTHGGPKADTRPERHQGGHKADNGGHMADKLRGRGRSISRPANSFF